MHQVGFAIPESDDTKSQEKGSDEGTPSATPTVETADSAKGNDHPASPEKEEEVMKKEEAKKEEAKKEETKEEGEEKTEIQASSTDGMKQETGSASS